MEELCDIPDLFSAPEAMSSVNEPDLTIFESDPGRADLSFEEPRDVEPLKAEGACTDDKLSLAPVKRRREDL